MGLLHTSAYSIYRMHSYYNIGSYLEIPSIM